MKYEDVQQMRKQAALDGQTDFLSRLLAWAETRAKYRGAQSRPDYRYGSNLERNVFHGVNYTPNELPFSGPGAYKNYALPDLDDIINSTRKKYGPEAAGYVAQNLFGNLKGRIDDLLPVPDSLSKPHALPSGVTSGAVEALIKQFQGQKAADQAKFTQDMMAGLGGNGGATESFDDIVNAMKEHMRRSLGGGARQAGGAAANAGRTAGSVARTASKHSSTAAKGVAGTARRVAGNIAGAFRGKGKGLAGLLGALGLAGAGYGGYKMSKSTSKKD